MRSINVDAFKSIGPKGMGQECGKGWAGLKGACKRSKAFGQDLKAARDASKKELAAKIKAKKIKLAEKGKSPSSAKKLSTAVKQKTEEVKVPTQGKAFTRAERKAEMQRRLADKNKSKKAVNTKKKIRTSRPATFRPAASRPAAFRPKAAITHSETHGTRVNGRSID